MPFVSAHDVAAELRQQLPGLPTKKLHKLLYYCQGHHLAHFGVPLFVEPLMAWDMGPVVANVWKCEKEGVEPPPPSQLDPAQLNTISYVVSRYGRLTGSDLERLTHAEDPWQLANTGREPGGSVRMEPDTVRAFFMTYGGPDDELPWPSNEDVAALAVGSALRRAAAAVPDDLADLRSRLVGR